MSSVGFRKVGGWDNINRMSKQLPTDVVRGAWLGQLKVAKTLSKIVKNHLKDQDLGWQPLSDNYARRKKENSDLILIETWKYYDAIKVIEKKNHVSVGVEKNRYYVGHKGSRIALWKVAAMHEGIGGGNNQFGKGIKLPIRPLWAPSAEELSRVGIAEMITLEIKRRLTKTGWPTAMKIIKKYRIPKMKKIKKYRIPK